MDGRIDWKPVLGFWLLIGALYAGKVAYGLMHGQPLLADTDDAMRMSVVRDFLAGQDWFDHRVARLDTPFGGSLHWSRLVDLPIAGLVLLFQPLAGVQAAIWAAFAWPLLLLLALLALSVRLTMRLVGPEGLLPGLVLPVLAVPVLAEFSPGRVDHHSVQILFTLALALCCLEAWRQPRWAVLAGLAAATSLAIGTETLPLICAGVLAFGLSWAFSPRHGRAMALFGLSFAGFALLHLAIALPRADWFVPACDALSSVYVAAALGVGMVFLLLGLLPFSRLPLAGRLLAGAVLGGLLVFGLLALFPHCLAGPYAALDPWLVDNWLDRIGEAKPAWQSLFDAPGYTLGALVPILVGLAALASLLVRVPAPERPAWLVLGLFLVLALAVTLLQIRGARMTALYAVPPTAWLITRCRAAYLRRGGAGSALLLVTVWLGAAGLAQAATIETLFPSPESRAAAASVPAEGGAAPAWPVAPPTRGTCLVPAAFDQLRALPAARVMAPVDLGAHILWETAHAVVAAPYHRAQRGIEDALHFFNRPLETVRPILAERGITLVVACPYLPEMAGFPDAAPDSFVRLAPADALPAWLEKISAPGAVLSIYRVLP